MIRGRKRPMAKVPEVKANLNCNIHNRFDIEVIDATTGKVTQRAQAENVICNALWTRLLAPANYFNYIHYGTGSGTPAATDASLFTYLGYGTPSTADDVYSSDNASGVISLRRKIQLGTGTANGSTLTEVGVGYGTSSGNLVTHAMLKDMNGNAISISKTSTDIINIYATVFLHWNASGYDGGFINIIDINQSTSDFITYPSLFSWLLGLSSTMNGGYSSLCWYTGDNTYFNNSTNRLAFTSVFSSGTKTITITLPRLTVSQGNIGGIKAFSLNYLMGSSYASTLMLVVGGSWYPNTDITGEAIGTGDGSTLDFTTDFPDISDITLYIDGIEQTSGYTIDENAPPTISDLSPYFRPIDCDGNSGPKPPIGNNSASYAIGAYSTYYNPFYAYGVKTIHAYRTSFTLEVSDDLSTWSKITISATGVITIPSEYRTKKYWRITALSADNYCFGIIVPDTLTSTNNIHFLTAPASGAVITADYTTKTIAKDANHVFDLSVVITLGEHTT